MICGFVMTKPFWLLTLSIKLEIHMEVAVDRWPYSNSNDNGLFLTTVRCTL